MILMCSCTCKCTQKLLTNTSQKRNKCSGCFIGNCKGKGLLTYVGGRFETTLNKLSIINQPDFVSAYSMNLDTPKSEIDEHKWNSITGEYVKDKTNEENPS